MLFLNKKEEKSSLIIIIIIIIGSFYLFFYYYFYNISDFINHLKLIFGFREGNLKKKTIILLFLVKNNAFKKKITQKISLTICCEAQTATLGLL